MRCKTFFMLLCSLLFLPLFASKEAILKVTPHVKLQTDNYVARVSNLMSRDNYDSAYILVTAGLSFADTTNYDEGKYYLYAFESEILYYHSLFSPALNSAYRALKFAEKLQNDTLIGSVQNLIGLLLSNLNQYDDAAQQLREAVQKLPFNHGNENLSYRFHAASNLCGVFLHFQQADSALHYARFSLAEASALNRHRAMAIDHWNIAKAQIIYKNYDSAYYYSILGKHIAEERNMPDVQMFFIALQADILMLKNNVAGSMELIKSGMQKIQNDKQLTVFSKIDFLNDAVNIAIKANEYALAAKAQVMLNLLKNQTDDKRNEEQIKTLERFYANEKQLEISESQRKKQELQARLNRLILISASGAVIFVFTIIAFYIYAYTQKQRLVTLQLRREKEAIEAQKEKEKIEERMEAANRERNRIAKELHDDIGSTLSSISMYSEIALKTNNENPLKSRELLQKVNQKAKELSENMSDIIWAVYSKNDSFNNLMMRMKNFAFEMVMPLDIEMDFCYPFQLDNIHLNAEQRKNIYYIFKEAVNNAVKHSSCSRINVLIDYSNDNKITMAIADNGKGFDVEAIKKNNGFYTMQSRAKTIGGSTGIHSVINSGTTVKVEFPLHYLG